MYLGFISEIGNVRGVDESGLRVFAPKAAAQLEPGGSLDVAGVCLSAEEIADGEIRVGLSTETRRRTTLGELRPGARVNVECPLRAGEALEGHLVQGHVDAVGKVLRVDEEATGRRVWLRPPRRFMETLEPKGSVTLDGVSLTVAEVLRRVIAASPWQGHVSGTLGVEKVVAQFRAGGCVVLWDPDREGEGDVIVAGADLRPRTVTFILTQVCGHMTVPCDLARLERLQIAPIPGADDHHATAMHVPVDLSASTGTGVSAEERAATVRQLAHPEARAADFVRPGHMFPLGARLGGLRERAGHTEATVELCRAAELPTVGVCCEIMSADGRMAGPAELERFALHWGLPLIDIAELASQL